MKEVYWIGGAVAVGSGGAEQTAFSALTAALQGSGVRGGWVERAVWLAPPAEEGAAGLALQSAGLRPEAPVFFWPAGPLRDHLLLHDAARSIETQDCRLMLVGQQNATAAGLGLLASPEAVGRYNLMPRARLAGRLALNPSGWQEVLAAVCRAFAQPELDPTATTWLAACNDAEPAGLQSDSASFPEARWLPPPAHARAGVAARLVELVQTLEEQNAPQGLLLSSLPGRPALVTRIERL